MSPLTLPLVLALAGADAAPGEAKQLWYTTYFYTAAEAIVHGYEPDTNVRIVSLKDRGTIYQGRIQPGDVQLIPTGAGVFGFLADKKASILVGTPSSCTAVGYFVKDQEGSFRSDHFFAQLPSSVSAPSAKVIVWAYDKTSVAIVDRTAKKTLFRGALGAGETHVFDGEALGLLSSHVLEISSETKNLAVQVYYDEGFVVPAKDGRASGRLFYTYVGDITEGVNDLQLISYHADALVLVEDAKSGERIWSGKVPRGGIHAITLARRYVKVTSDREISVGVGPFAHYGAGYAEHHFAMGAEGTGIENDFLVTTPGELWIFSYFDGSAIDVTNARTGKRVWKGALSAGKVRGLTPGFGMFRVKSTKGISVMGGSSACGGEYSPAAGMFAVDQELFKVIAEIQEQRRARAAAEGRGYTAADAAAPLSEEEMKTAQTRVKAATGRATPMSAPEIQERLDTMVAH